MVLAKMAMTYLNHARAALARMGILECHRLTRALHQSTIVSCWVGSGGDFLQFQNIYMEKSDEALCRRGSNDVVHMAAGMEQKKSEPPLKYSRIFGARGKSSLSK